MPSHWTAGAVPMLLRRHSGTIALRGATVESATRLISPLPFRRPYVTTTTQASRSSTSESTTSSTLKGEELSEGTDLKTTSQNFATFYLDMIRSRLRKHASLISSATLNLAEMGGRLNKVTGYEHIEKLKHKIVETEAAITSKRQASRDAKVAYEMAVARRSNSQREVNDLLQRKSSWTDSDVSRFTALVRQDHLYEQEEASAKAQVAVAEAEVETEFNSLMRTILNRYHEEQVWSDKIRSVSTYGSLLALGVNICVFILAIVVVEPWKRRRLAQTFESRIEQLSLENRERLGKGMSDLAEHFAKQELVLAEMAGASTRNNIREHDTRAQPEAGEDAAHPTLLIAKTAKSARDRDLWIVGTVGALSGGILTIMLGFFR